MALLSCATSPGSEPAEQEDAGFDVDAFVYNHDADTLPPPGPLPGPILNGEESWGGADFGQASGCSIPPCRGPAAE